MPKYEADDCLRVMGDPSAVRNVCMLGSMGHGKSSLIDSLGARAGFVAENKVGETLFTLYREDERAKKVLTNTILNIYANTYTTYTHSLISIPKISFKKLELVELVGLVPDYPYK